MLSYFLWAKFKGVNVLFTCAQGNIAPTPIILAYASGLQVQSNFSFSSFEGACCFFKQP